MYKNIHTPKKRMYYPFNTLIGLAISVILLAFIEVSVDVTKWFFLVLGSLYTMAVFIQMMFYTLTLYDTGRISETTFSTISITVDLYLAQLMAYTLLFITFFFFDTGPHTLFFSGFDPTVNEYELWLQFLSYTILVCVKVGFGPFIPVHTVTQILTAIFVLIHELYVILLVIVSLTVIVNKIGTRSSTTKPKVSSKVKHR